MSELGDKQRKLPPMLATLISYAYSTGYEMTVGDAYRDPRCNYGNPRTLHRQRLAMDFNVFKNGLWLQDTTDLAELGEVWEKMGGSWGGRFNDGNHFSLSYGGMR